MIESSTKTGGFSLPDDFLLGAATAAHQVEGDNKHCDWWEFEQRGLLPVQSARACGHYDLYERDFDLAASMGHSCHRLSVEWSRVEPRDGEWNDKAASHYAKVFKALRDRGLEPIVTLHHFTLPAWVLEAGGWASSETPERFARFVDRFVVQAGQGVKYWLTINEPTVYVQQSYINGEWPPLRSNAWYSGYKVFRNLSRAHVLAYERLKNACPESMVGFAHGALDIQPCDPNNIADRLSAAVRDYILNKLFFRMIGASRKSEDGGRTSLDFIGINYYTRCCVKSGGFGPSLLVGQACKLNHHADSGIQSSIGWEVYPKGLTKVLDRFAEYDIPMFITENGIAIDDDNLRCQFLVDHLRVVAEAMAKGKTILGYLHWSLIDNFEWRLGYEPRFGLVEVDFDSLERRVKPSGELFARICKTRRVDY